MAELYGANKEEFMTSMAALILYDGEAEITSDNISTILGAANVSVAPYWPSLFASFLKGGRADDIVFSIGGGVAAAAVADAGAPGAAAAAEEPKKAEKPKEEEVDALEGGMDMFGGGGSDY